jgi:hypothetical protein
MPPRIVDCSFRPPSESASVKAPVAEVNCGFDPDAAKASEPAKSEKESPAPAKSRK